MAFGILIGAILLIVSGAIAYIGDNLGRRIGKKKITIFGLRPKHTSIVITIITGVMITSVTLGVILAVSRQARTAFFGLKKLSGELDAKTRERERLHNELTAANKEYLSLTKKRDILDGKYRKVLRDYNREQDELNDLAGEINLKTVDLDRAQADLIKTVRDIEAKTSEIKRKTEEINRKTREIGTKNDEIQGLENQRSKLIGERDALIRHRESLEANIKDMVTEMGEMRRDVLHGEFLYRKHQALARFIVEPGITSDDLENSLRESVGVLLDAARKQGAVLGPDADMFHDIQYQKVWNALESSRNQLVVEAMSATNVFAGEPFYVELQPYENRILFHKGEIVASELAAPGMSEDQARDLLSRMISGVMDVARRRGILPDVQTSMVGNIPASRFIEAQAAILSATGVSTIEFFATHDTRMSDTLNIDFRIH